MKTILFDSRAGFLDRQSLMHQYIERLPDKEIRPVSVFHDHVSYNKYKYLKDTELLSNYWNPGHKAYTKSDISKIEEKYGQINFWNIIASDRFIRRWPEVKIIEQISFYIYAWEKIIEKYKPLFIISETVTGLWNYILILICKSNGIKYLSVQTTKNTGRYYYSDDQYGRWKELEDKFIEIKQRGLTINEKLLAQQFVKNFREHPLVPPYMKQSSALPNFKKYINLPRFIINLKKDLIQNWYYSNHDYKLGYRIFDYVYTLIRVKRILASKFFKIFEFPDFEKDYVLFPVHFQPEATTDIWAPFYSDQLYTIKAIARSLPFGFYLYVKEHISVLGSKKIFFYKEIKKIPNVKLINPWSNISDLIKNSKAVAVITSTTGLESIFWNKPTIVFGNVFYNIYPFVHRINNINDFPEYLGKILSEKIEEDNPDRLAFVYIYSMLGYESDIYDYQLTEERISGFVRDLLEEIEKQ